MEMWIVLRFVLGLLLLFVGAEALVRGASRLATGLGISPLVIGLTVVAFGTSAPELAVSLGAALSGTGGAGVALGNVVGSTIFNLLCVLGATAVVAPGGLPVSRAALAFDLPVMLAATAACLPVSFAGQRISRWMGGLFVAHYLAYVTYLILRAAEHDALSTFSRGLIGFVLPLTTVALLVPAWRHLRRTRSGP